MNPRIEILAETGSTNADLAARLASGEHVAEGAWLVADRQTAGKGRQGRAWSDGSGNFMGSTIVRRGPNDPAAPTLALLAGLALYETVSPVIAGAAPLALKWPNDLLLGGAKLAGILLEGVGEAVIVGIGVNLAHSPDLPDRRTAALADLGPAPDRDLFARELASNWIVELDRWRQFGLDPVLRRWTALAHAAGSSLTVHEPNGTTVSGAFAGLAQDGALQLRLADGTIRIVHAGDVHWEGR